MRKLGITVGVGLAGAALLLTSTAAGAGTGKNTKQAAGASAPAAGKSAPAFASPRSPLSPPGDYRVVNSSSLIAADGMQTRGSVTCPGTRFPVGGGAIVSLRSVAASINSSFPSGNTWIADVNNSSGTVTTFAVYAVCAGHPSSYSVQTSGQVTKRPTGRVGNSASEAG